ncbi:hypothetical protein EV401DRAFT_1857935 [Pisolithus croceorrhizus]|nr:hypothetical protein EV401DRAFT_1857935 [Pisolithus croceorrhizus]
MAQLMNTPLELLIVIFNFVLKPHHLAALCLVNRAFNRFATPLLYRQIYIFPWHKDSKSKVFSLFSTLDECPHLAAYVQTLEIRDFPKGLSTEDHSYLSGRCIRAIQQCTNLRSCTWTKDGSIHSELLESLLNCQQLRELEINGNSAGYDPLILTQFQNLRKISLIMPSVRVLSVLPMWIKASGATLRNLRIICKAWNNTRYLQQTLNKCVQASTHVTDGLLESLSPNLAELECLHIFGCPKVTHKGIGALVSANRSGLFAINLEHLSLSFDMGVFRILCHRTQAFRRLRTITLTVPAHTSMSDWARDVHDLLGSAPLEAFELYSTNVLSDTQMAGDFWQKMVTSHGFRLKRISVHRIRVNLATLHIICSQCPRLEQLFVETERRDLERAVSSFSLARNLRSLHINFPLARSEAPTPPAATMHTALSISSRCSPTLTHIGFNTQVWQVMRVVRAYENGEEHTEPTLVPRENPEIPEQFLVGTM